MVNSFFLKILAAGGKGLYALQIQQVYGNLLKTKGVTFLKIQKASEDYLETMLMLRESHGYIRSIDIAEHMGVTKPSVSYAVKRLRENGFITMDPDGPLHLTESGLAIAKRIFERHELLIRVLTNLGVSPEVAREDACKIEHDLSDETFAAIRAHVNQFPS